MNDFGYPVGSYDPDEEETNIVKRPSWSIPKTDLAKDALSSCGRKFFKDKPEYMRWKNLEGKTFGLTDEDYMFKKWIEKQTKYFSGTLNARAVVASFDRLISACENTEKCVDWITKNTPRLIAERKTAGIEDLEELLTKRK